MAKVMEEAIRSVGLGNRGLSAKDFRHTGATAAIDSGFHPDIVKKTGRRKRPQIFAITMYIQSHRRSTHTIIYFTSNRLNNDSLLRQ